MERMLTVGRNFAGTRRELQIARKLRQNSRRRSRYGALQSPLAILPLLFGGVRFSSRELKRRLAKLKHSAWSAPRVRSVGAVRSNRIRSSEHTRSTIRQPPHLLQTGERSLPASARLA